MIPLDLSPVADISALSVVGSLSTLNKHDITFILIFRLFPHKQDIYMLNKLIKRSQMKDEDGLILHFFSLYVKKKKKIQ